MNKSIGRLISILHRKSQIYINYSLNEYDITSAEYSFLLCLFKRDAVTQEELSSYLYIDKSATARAVKSLEHKGYITKIKEDDDRRFNRIYLTDKAKNIENKIKERICSWSEFLMKDVEKDTANIVYDVLQSMVDKVDVANLKNIMGE